MKNCDNTGWIFVLPAALVLGLIGLIPLITVINYSFFEIFILDARFWVGITLAIIALPLLVPWNMIPSLWLSLLNPETGILGGCSLRLAGLPIGRSPVRILGR
ncbi:MAG: hypothetical protein P8P56_13845 [Yoonia sp.]|nr:hypothetical protein [Yoonia sp.]MDG1861975.1 hypothetical protein [Yoonia sp.]